MTTCHRPWYLFAFIGICLLWGGHPAFGSRFALFALDAEVPLQNGQSIGKAREAAIIQGLRQAVEEAIYKLLPPEGLGINNQKVSSQILDKAGHFVPQYKILGERQSPGTFEVSLQVTVDLVLLRKALISLGLIKTERGKGTIPNSPSTLVIRNLVDGTVLMEVINFFKQRPDLADHFALVTARHGEFTFQFFPMVSLDKIVTQILYHAQVTKGTFKLIKQGKDQLIFSYQSGPSS